MQHYDVNFVFFILFLVHIFITFDSTALDGSSIVNVKFLFFFNLYK